MNAYMVAIKGYNLGTFLLLKENTLQQAFTTAKQTLVELGITNQNSDITIEDLKVVGVERNEQLAV